MYPGLNSLGKTHTRRHFQLLARKPRALWPTVFSPAAATQTYRPQWPAAPFSSCWQSDLATCIPVAPVAGPQTSLAYQTLWVLVPRSAGSATHGLFSGCCCLHLAALAHRIVSGIHAEKKGINKEMMETAGRESGCLECKLSKVLQRLINKSLFGFLLLGLSLLKLSKKPFQSLHLPLGD